MAALFLPICHIAELAFAVLGRGHGTKAEAWAGKCLALGSVPIWQQDLAFGHLSTGAKLRAKHLICLQEEKRGRPWQAVLSVFGAPHTPLYSVPYSGIGHSLEKGKLLQAEVVVFNQ